MKKKDFLTMELKSGNGKNKAIIYLINLFFSDFYHIFVLNKDI